MEITIRFLRFHLCNVQTKALCLKTKVEHITELSLISQSESVPADKFYFAAHCFILKEKQALSLLIKVDWKNA